MTETNNIISLKCGAPGDTKTATEDIQKIVDKVIYNKYLQIPII